MGAGKGGDQSKEGARATAWTGFAESWSLTSFFVAPTYDVIATLERKRSKRQCHGFHRSLCFPFTLLLLEIQGKRIISQSVRFSVLSGLEGRNNSEASFTPLWDFNIPNRNYELLETHVW